MKKILSLLAVVAMLVSLCACGGNITQTSTSSDDVSTSEKNIKDAYIGVWETEELRLMISKGGVGKWGFLAADEEFDKASIPINWEIKDDVLVVDFSIAGFDYNAVFELNDSATTLNEIQKSGAFSGDVENDTEYLKRP